MELASLSSDESSSVSIALADKTEEVPTLADNARVAHPPGVNSGSGREGFVEGHGFSRAVRGTKNRGP
jgi:hypothetical protein